MTEIDTVVENEAGIHCRPSSVILMKRQEYPGCTVSISSEKGDVQLHSIISLLGLGLAKGDKVTVQAEGENEETACREIADLFAYHFDYPPEEQNG